MKSMLALFFLLGSAFAGYPLSFPTNTASTPEGITYWSGNGGGYFVGSAALGTVNWVSTTGSYVPNVLVDTNASDAGYTVFGLYVVTVVSGHDILLAARANLLATPVPISAVTAFDLGEGTFGQKLWTVYLGAGWANDLTLDSNGDAYVTDTKLGKIWRLNAPDLTAPTTEIFASSTAFLPNNATNLFSVGINGIRACPTSSSSLDEYIVTGIADGGVSRTRLYCVNTVNGSDITPITFANAAAYPLINYAVFDGMEFFPTGELMFTGAPAGAGIITAYGGDFCQPGTTYNITMFKNISQAINNGNLLTTVTWNCDFNIMATLGTSFNLFLQIPQPPSYGIYVANGTLPYSGSNFAPGNDCSAAVNVIPGPVVPSLYYDMLCFMQSRVTIPAASSCGTGFGIWFRINVTGLTGVWDFTTRTDFTGFDNYLSLYSTCPTTCAYVPNDPYIDCQDDVSNFVGGCGVSTSSRCSAIALNLSAAAYTEIYAVINFFSSPTIAPCVTGTTTTQPNYFTTFAVVPHDVVPPNPSTPFPNQICDPCVVVPTSSSAATGSTNGTTGTGTTAPTATGTATTAATATTSATGTATTANTNPTGNTANTNPTGNTANTNPTGTTNSNPATSASPSPSGSGTTTSSTSSSGNDNAGSSDSVRASLFF